MASPRKNKLRHKVKMALTGRLSAYEHSPAGRKHLKSKSNRGEQLVNKRLKQVLTKEELRRLGIS